MFLFSTAGKFDFGLFLISNMLLIHGLLNA